MSEPQFFNSAVVRVPEILVLKGGALRRISIGVRYGLMLHPAHGPVLIDTGYGSRVTEGRQRSLALKLYGATLRPKLVRENLPVAALAQKGFTPGDVKTIIVTHYHPDHVAALQDFPNARFVASGTAWEEIKRMRGGQRLRNVVFPELLPEDFSERLDVIEQRPTIGLPLGLGEGWDIFGDGLCVGVDLPGHALGHFGVCWPQLEPPLLYAVDVQWLVEAVLLDRLPWGPAQLVYASGSGARASAAKVRRFAEAGGGIALCHDRVDG